MRAPGGRPQRVLHVPVLPVRPEAVLEVPVHRLAQPVLPLGLLGPAQGRELLVADEVALVVEGAVADVDDPVGGDVEDGGDVLFCSGGSSLRGLFLSG